MLESGTYYRHLVRVLADELPELAAELNKLDVIENAQRAARQSSSAPNSKEKGQPVPPISSPEIPDYEIIRLLGQGGFGMVWLARNRHDGQFCAIKTLRAGRESEIEGIREFKKRAEANPYLFPIGHVGKTNDTYYCVMPLADHAFVASAVVSSDVYEPLTLEQYIRGRGTLPAAEVLAISREMLLGLDQLHSAGGIHRDVKPSNILRLDGKWRLGDPGLVTGAESIPNPGGTRVFRPPERIQNPSGDLYALGVTNYILATGDHSGEVQNLHDKAVKLAGPKQDVATLRRVILRACHARPEVRFQSAKEMRDAIGTASRARSRPVAVGAIIAGLIVLAAPLLFMWLDSSAQDQRAKIATSSPASSAGKVRIAAADIELVRPTKSGDPAELGSLGSTVFAAKENDWVRVKIKLNGPAHA